MESMITARFTGSWIFLFVTVSTFTDLDNGERGITFATNAQMKNERKDNKEREIVTKLTACSQPTNNLFMHSWLFINFCFDNF
jgi:hypothetical protein